MPETSDEQASDQPTQARTFADFPSSSSESAFFSTAQPHPHQSFQPLPNPTGPSPYHLALESVLPAQNIQAITAAQRLVFHIVGDTGGVKSPEPQQIVAQHMVSDLTGSDPAAQPAFFYNLGDVVYYYGEHKEYYPQFYDPYIHYNAPIFAIPGNHDGDVFDTSVRSLDAFVTNFCAREPQVTPDAGDTRRDAMTQPHVYWTLEAPFVTIIGLYTNVPEGGQLDSTQIAWLESELASADKEKALLVAMHHPIYSADNFHSGSAYMARVLDDAIQASGRVPDAVFAGHVHNYQRFTRSFKGRDIPYIVAGSGGYWHLHSVQTPQGAAIQTPYKASPTDATLESYCDDHHGYLLLEVSKETLKGTYYAVPRPQDSWSQPATQIDTFTLNLQEHHLLPNKG